MAGKEHPRITPEDILSLEVPLPPLVDQDKLVAGLDALSEKCRELERAIGNELDLVDGYMDRRFGLSIAKLDAEIEHQDRQLRVADVVANPDLRFSFKFHAPSVEFALKCLRALPHRRVSQFLAEDIVLGASVSPNDYEADSKKLYLSMATIKTWSFDKVSANGVSERYFKANAAKAVKADDLLMARSGEGTIGKVALVPAGIVGICADFTMRIRFDPARCLPAFARFYLMSKYFQHVVYGEKKGLGNNTNIFPIQLRELPFIDVSMTEQELAVQELTEAQGAHLAERERIKTLRARMEEVLTLGLTGKPYAQLLT
jgi:type I restriction enzyme S subunit